MQILAKNMTEGNNERVVKPVPAPVNAPLGKNIIITYYYHFILK